MMKLKTIASIVGLSVVGALAGAAPAAAITVGDGSLADWGVTVGDNNTSNFATVAPVGATLLGSSASDNNDNSNSYNFAPTPGGPLGGGQNFDSEFLAAAQNGKHLYIAISTGQRPDNGAATYEPADLRITNVGGANPGTYGVELGASGGAAITATGGAGATYKLDAFANANGLDATPAGQTIGRIFSNATFRGGAYGIQGNPGTQLDTNPAVHSDNNLSNKDAFNNNIGAQNMVGSGTAIGTVTSLYESGNTVTTQHQIIELDIDLETLLQTGTDHSSWSTTFLSLQYGPACANDLVVTFALPPSGDIPNPEPATLALFGLGVLGLGFMRRRKAA